MTDDRRKQRRQTRLMQSESSWLQKALFALRKVEDSRDRIADMHDDEPEPYTLEVDGTELTIEAIEDAIETRATNLQNEIRERRNRM